MASDVVQTLTSARHAGLKAGTATFVLAALILGACGQKPQPGTLTIAVIPKGTSHVFWQSIHAGAEKAAREVGATIIWRGPLREDDRDSQVSEVEGFVSRGVSGIVLAPLDEAALAGPVADATQRGIPVVVIDSGLKGHDYVSFVATDNHQGGRLAGEHLAGLLKDGGKVVMLRYAEGSDSTLQREAGFLEAIGARPGLEVLSANQYGGADVEGAYKKSESLLGRFKRPDGSLGVDGIFTPNESTTLAMLRVLEDNGWAGKVRFVGFDASDTLVKGLSDAHLDGLVLQDPVNMGYLGVKTIVSHIHGQPIEPRIDTGVRLITRDRMNDADAKELLHPDLSPMAEALSEARFEMRGVGKSFGATVALDSVDCAVRPGEVCALVGQNGAGKSTLMAILAGAITPDRGAMRLDGRPFAPRDPFDARRAGVAMIYQELSLAPHLNVMENIVLGVEPVRHGVVQRRRMREIATAAMRQLGHDDIAPETLVEDLPPAAQQLVEIARALATGCRVLVLDEPTSSLGHADVRALFDLIGRLKATGIAIVYISHFIEEVKAVSDRVVVLRDGRNAGEGSTGETGVADIVAMMVGRTLGELYPRGARSAGEPILRLDGVMPGAATLALHRGEILGIAGLLGAGRTRLLRAIFALDSVTGGAVTVGAYSGPSTPHDRWRQGMGLLSEERSVEGLALGASVADNMTLTRLEPFGPGFVVRPSKQLAAAQRWIDRLGIRCADGGQAVAELSGGNQQKVAVARLLHHQVDVLLLDEPTRGIDVASKAQIYALIDELVTGADRKAVLLVSSYLPELLGVCDRIAVMSRGRLGPARPVEAWTEHSLLMDASGARAAS